MSLASRLEWYMLDLINAERAKVGRDPLELEVRLNDSSEDHNAWMLNRDVFSHTGRNGSSAGDRMEDAGFTFSGSWSWGENIAWQSERGSEGVRDDVKNLHDALMNSPGHRANILSDSFDFIGIGISVGDFNGYEAVMVTQNFARTAAPVQIDPGQSPTPPQNTEPEITTTDVDLARVKGHRWADLSDVLSVTDPDGDTIQWVKIRDKSGTHSFLWDDKTVINARKPLRIDLDDLDHIILRSEPSPGPSTVEIRASDGKDVTDWVPLTINTLAPDDVLIV